MFEELDTGDVAKARDVYSEALKLVPHRHFTFGKLWVLAAKFELRQMELGRARKLLGQAIGMAPKARSATPSIPVQCMPCGVTERAAARPLLQLHSEKAAVLTS